MGYQELIIKISLIVIIVMLILFMYWSITMIHIHKIIIEHFKIYKNKKWELASTIVLPILISALLAFCIRKVDSNFITCIVTLVTILSGFLINAILFLNYFYDKICENKKDIQTDDERKLFEGKLGALETLFNSIVYSLVLSFLVILFSLIWLLFIENKFLIFLNMYVLIQFGITFLFIFSTIMTLLSPKFRNDTDL